MAVRALRRVASGLIALSVLAVSTITIVEVTLAALGRPPWLIDDMAARDKLAGRTWDDPMVILGWVSLVLLGAGLLAIALAAGRARNIALDSGTEAASLSVRRRSLEGYLAGVATAQPGVRAAKASVKRGRIRVRADTTRLDTQEVRARLHEAVTDRVRALGLEPRTVSVSLHSKKG